MSGRFDIARALAATNGSNAVQGRINPRSLSRRDVDQKKSIEEVIKTAKKVAPRPNKRDPEPLHPRKQPPAKRRPPTKKIIKLVDDDEEPNPLQSLDIDQLLDFVSVVGTGVLEGHQAGSIKPKPPTTPPPRPKVTRAIDAPTETGEELAAIIKALEQKKEAAVNQEEIVRTLLSGGPDAPLPSPEQLNKLLADATSNDKMKSTPAAAPVTPEEVIRKVLGDGGIRGAPKTPKLSDLPETKLLKDVIIRQQNELDKLRDMLKQCLDHTDELKEAHKKHASMQQKEIERLQQKLKEQQKEGKQKKNSEESLAEQLRRKFAAANQRATTAPTHEASRSTRYPEEHRRSSQSYKNARVSPVDHTEPEEHLRRSELSYQIRRGNFTEHPESVEQLRRKRLNYRIARGNPTEHPESEEQLRRISNLSYKVVRGNPTEHPEPRSYVMANKSQTSYRRTEAVEKSKEDMEPVPDVAPSYKMDAGTQSDHKERCAESQRTKQTGESDVIDLSVDSDNDGDDPESDLTDAEELSDTNSSNSVTSVLAQNPRAGKDPEMGCNVDSEKIDAKRGKEPEDGATREETPFESADMKNAEKVEMASPTNVTMSEGTEANATKIVDPEVEATSSPDDAMLEENKDPDPAEDNKVMLEENKDPDLAKDNKEELPSAVGGVQNDGDSMKIEKPEESRVESDIRKNESEDDIKSSTEASVEDNDDTEDKKDEKDVEMLAPEESKCRDEDCEPLPSPTAVVTQNATEEGEELAEAKDTPSMNGQPERKESKCKDENSDHPRPMVVAAQDAIEEGEEVAHFQDDDTPPMKDQLEPAKSSCKDEECEAQPRPQPQLSVVTQDAVEEGKEVVNTAVDDTVCTKEQEQESADLEGGPEVGLKAREFEDGDISRNESKQDNHNETPVPADVTHAQLEAPTDSAPQPERLLIDCTDNLGFRSISVPNNSLEVSHVGEEPKKGLDPDGDEAPRKHVDLELDLRKRVDQGKTEKGRRGMDPDGGEDQGHSSIKQEPFENGRGKDPELHAEGSQEKNAEKQGMNQERAELPSVQEDSDDKPVEVTDVTMEEEGENSIPAPKAPVFVSKLHEALNVLEAEAQQGIASFLVSGKGFTIRNPQAFAEQVIPRFFPTLSYPSFQRQLNSYEFKFLSAGPDVEAYYHKNFIKGDAARAVLIKRNVKKGFLSQKLKEQRQRECSDCLVTDQERSQDKFKARQLSIESLRGDNKESLPSDIPQEVNNESKSQTMEEEVDESMLWL